jgi:signal transduction histidine kinase
LFIKAYFYPIFSSNPLQKTAFFLVLLSILVGCRAPAPIEQPVTHDEFIDSATELNQLFISQRRNNLEQAMIYAQNELAISLPIGYRKGIAEGFQNTGFVHYYRNDLPEALDAYLMSLQHMEALKDSSGIAECSYVLGKIHREQGNYSKALEYSFRALEIRKAKKDVGGTSSVLNGIGNIYIAKKNYDSALIYFSQRMTLERMRGDSAGVASVYTDIGNVLTEKGNAEEGLASHLKALEKLEGMNKDSSVWYLLKFKSGVLIDLANSYLILQQYEPAISASKESLSLAVTTNARKEKRNAYKMLADIYRAMNNKQEEAVYLEYYVGLNDSLLNEESIKQVANADAKYESEKKKREIASLNEENALLDLERQRAEENKKMILIGVAAFLLLGGIIGWIVYSRNRLKQQQEQFRAVIEGEENERKRIAMELHDGLGQLLSAARLNVSGLEDNVAKEDDEVVRTSLSLIDDACQEVRSISHNLMPAALIRLGLVAALRELAAKTSQAGRVHVTVDHEKLAVKPANDEEIALYRIIQEVMNNALKHAAANTINVKLMSIGGEVIVTISDDGAGMNLQQIESSSGIGWKNIRSRVQLLQGKLDIRSAPGKGTTVEIRINCTLQPNQE